MLSLHSIHGQFSYGTAKIDLDLEVFAANLLSSLNDIFSKPNHECQLGKCECLPGYMKVGDDCKCIVGRISFWLFFSIYVWSGSRSSVWFIEKSFLQSLTVTRSTFPFKQLILPLSHVKVSTSVRKRSSHQLPKVFALGQMVSPPWVTWRSSLPSFIGFWKYSSLHLQIQSNNLYFILENKITKQKTKHKVYVSGIHPSEKAG